MSLDCLASGFKLRGCVQCRVSVSVKKCLVYSLQFNESSVLSVSMSALVIKHSRIV